VQHQGDSEFVQALRRAAHGVRMLAAHTIGTTCIVAGSYLAKKLVENLPDGTAPESSSPPPSPSAAHHTPDKKQAA
jgi:hypothetical protein